MKHPLTPSINVIGALPLSELNSQSVLGAPTDAMERLDAFDRLAARYYHQELPGQVLYVDRLPRRRKNDDYTIGVGYITAWATENRSTHGVLFEKLDEAIEFGRIAGKGFLTAQMALYRGASIAKFNHRSQTDDRSVVVDAEAYNWHPGDPVHWASPDRIYPVEHSN